ncbi:MAG: hypothetical protein AAGG75_19410 [Bacteroidota bacterium]
MKKLSAIPFLILMACCALFFVCCQQQNDVFPQPDAAQSIVDQEITEIPYDGELEEIPTIKSNEEEKGIKVLGDPVYCIYKVRSTTRRTSVMQPGDYVCVDCPDPSPFASCPGALGLVTRFRYIGSHPRDNFDGKWKLMELRCEKCPSRGNRGFRFSD